MTSHSIAPCSRWLIFTDLDGTLLDHHDYSHSAASAALTELERLGVPVIINSSKTPGEIAAIAAELGLKTPQIAENGSIVYYPDSKSTHVIGSDYASICTILDQLRDRHDFKCHGFHDWTPQQIATHTGLPAAAAAKAAQRQGSEPLLWHDTDQRLEEFREHLQANRLTLKRGGRFWHVMGQTDKVKAMHHVQHGYEQDWGRKAFIIALGDSANDKEMLAAADVAIIVKNPHGMPFTLPATASPTERRVMRTSLAGPAGWNEAMLMLLSETTH